MRRDRYRPPDEHTGAVTLNVVLKYNDAWHQALPGYFCGPTSTALPILVDALMHVAGVDAWSKLVGTHTHALVNPETDMVEGLASSPGNTERVVLLRDLQDRFQRTQTRGNRFPDDVIDAVRADFRDEGEA